MIERKIKFGNLFDFYGQLLTEKQQKILQMYYLEDFSLGEIGDIASVSRQAIYDVVKRAEKILDDYENKLELYKKFNEQNRLLEDILNDIDQGLSENDISRFKDIKAKLEGIIN